MNNRLLITGSAGFIGFHLAHRLLQDGFTVIGLDNVLVQRKLDKWLCNLSE